VADLISYQDQIFIAINGYGVARLGWEDRSSFTYYNKPDLFGYRTFTHLLPLESALLCHFYFNTILNEVKKRELDRQGVNMMMFDPDGGEWLTPVIPAFQRDNPEWEAITLLPYGGDQLWLEWKRSGSEQVHFRYSSYRLSSGTENPLSRERFRQAIGFVSNNDFAPILRKLAAELEQMGLYADRYHFLFESGQSPDRRLVWEGVRVGSGTKSFRVARKEKSFFMLVPQGKLVEVDEESLESAVYTLPDLPKGFVYQDFQWLGHRVVLSWEEVDFIHVGAAGIQIWNPPEEG
jgi:hypothetical protein